MKANEPIPSLFKRAAIVFSALVLVLQTSGAQTVLDQDMIIVDPNHAPTSGITPEWVRSIRETVESGTNFASITIDYPFDRSVFPPEIVAPTFLWHDSHPESDLWLIEIGFANEPFRIYSLTQGAQEEPVLDPAAISPANEHYRRPDYEVSAKAWMPDGSAWRMIKEHSTGRSAFFQIYGLDSHDPSKVRSTGRFTFSTSGDPAGAPIFYRDVPLMPTRSMEGDIKPIGQNNLPLIAWRLRDISKPSAPVVLRDMPTCANCHSFSADGRVLGMDMDGPDGDKGAYGITEVKSEIVIEEDDILTWNSYKGTPEGHKNFGLFSQVSPNGRYVVSTLNEAIFVVNYSIFNFLQSFYPTRGILVVYDRETGEMAPLPGADDTRYVQANATWSPDGTELVFSRAPAKDRFDGTDMPTHAGDERETVIQYDLYRIPFNAGKGGKAEPVEGASGNGMSNSFPKFSPDGKWIVFVQALRGQLMRPDSKLYIIPARGGPARKLDCNLDPMNSWHSWSPNSRWLVFSSKGFGPFTKLFLTHIDENGNDTPAILIPNSTAANRAANIPEFLNGPGDAIASIRAPTQESYRLFNNAKDLAREGRWTDALAMMDESIAGNPYYATAYLEKGFILFELGRNQEGIEHLEKAVALEPSRGNPNHAVARIMGMKGKNDEAIPYLDKVLQKNPGLAETHVLLADLYKEKGDAALAINHYRCAAQLDPSRPDYQADLGTLLLLEHEYDAAIRCYEKALELDSGQPGVLYNLGKIYQTLGDDDKATMYFQRSEELNPSPPHTSTSHAP